MGRVTLLLEGTYPYITGGVSSCAHQIIERCHELSFDLVFIGSRKVDYSGYKYKIPKNVSSISELFLYDFDYYEDHNAVGFIGLSPYEIELIENSLLFNHKENFDEFFNHFFNQHRNYRIEDLLVSKEIWNILTKKYERDYRTHHVRSFIDYFYNWRFSNLPILKILDFSLAPSDVFHSLSTGFAGLLGAVAKLRRLGNFVLTEHGIYTHERKIEIAHSDWIYSSDQNLSVKKSFPFFKQLWLDKFLGMGDITYQNADVITTLHSGNKARQVELGAPVEKIKIIANGISEAKLKVSEEEESQVYKSNKKYTVGLVGRIVPIKDIKTFIKSISVVTEVIPKEDLEVLIMGPTDEAPDYFDDCLRLRKLLGLENVINFTEKVNLKFYYPALDCMVLTSISEGQPLVLLEAFCKKIPVIATDVGSCHELVFGETLNDRELGAAGCIVEFGDSEGIGREIINILLDDEKRKKMGESGYNRFDKFYREEFSFLQYKKLYSRFLLGEV